MQPQLAESIHGGPDAEGVPRHDFSTNANACGPCAIVVEALRHTDATHYPDPHYTLLREQLAAFHGVDAARIVMAASASEFMHRISAFAARCGIRRVVVPQHGYGDYARAAQVWGLDVGDSAAPALHWACEPASPLGVQDVALEGWWAERSVLGLRVLDCAYVPLRLGNPAPCLPDSAWQLWTPNKALALTGIRAAYAIAPQQTPEAEVQALRAMAASWPVGAHGVTMLQAWVSEDVQQWLGGCLPTLRAWKATQIAHCEALGWQVVEGSLANYFTARLPQHIDMPVMAARLREHGIKLRDCASFGLPQHVRLGVLPPASQHALVQHWIEEFGS